MYQLAYQRPNNNTMLPVLREARDEQLNVYLSAWLDPVAQTETREGNFLVVDARDDGNVVLRPWAGVDVPTGSGDDFQLSTAAISFLQVG